ncbi:MAG: biopolymer transporter ExbD [Rubrivivax sp.]|nr:biopolymer transporter ExbD [Rubrivivax sp.]MDP3222007.1 biopolymer transporter ExbD [Rubrivivax sp.]
MAAMTPLEKRAERKARNKSALDMNLVALIDVFTILIFFLLSSASGVDILVSPKAVDLPLAMAEKTPKETVLLVVAGDDIIVDGRRIASVAQVMAAPEATIPALKAELDLLGTRTAVRAENKAEQQAVTIMADKQMPYSLLRKVMSTCAQSNFADVSFAVRRRDT